RLPCEDRCRPRNVTEDGDLADALPRHGDVPEIDAAAFHTQGSCRKDVEAIARIAFPDESCACGNIEPYRSTSDGLQLRCGQGPEDRSGAQERDLARRDAHTALESRQAPPTERDEDGQDRGHGDDGTDESERLDEDRDEHGSGGKTRHPKTLLEAEDPREDLVPD